MRHDIAVYLAIWDKPGTRAAPGGFYREMKTELGDDVKSIQRSVYRVKTIETARRLAESARRYGLKVAIFLATEIPTSNS
jgi:hypothetical protein